MIVSSSEALKNLFEAKIEPFNGNFNEKDNNSEVINIKAFLKSQNQIFGYFSKVMFSESNEEKGHIPN